MSKYSLFFLIILFLYLPKNISAQTSEIENYQVYTREAGCSSLGYMRLKFDLDPSIGGTIVNYGVSYNHYYDITPIGSVPINDNNQFSIYLTGAFKIGLATANQNEELNMAAGKELTYYAFVIDCYNLSIVPEYTHVLDNGYALTAKFGVNLFNLGATVAFPKGGSLNKNLIVSANLFPLAFFPSLFIDFGRTGLGISFYINPINILAYNYIPNGTYFDSANNEHNYFDQSLKGVKAFSSAIKRYDFQLMFTF
jgi:hypothetical protein